MGADEMLAGSRTGALLRFTAKCPHCGHTFSSDSEREVKAWPVAHARACPEWRLLK